MCLFWRDLLDISIKCFLTCVCRSVGPDKSSVHLTSPFVPRATNTQANSLSFFFIIICCFFFFLVNLASESTWHLKIRCVIKQKVGVCAYFKQRIAWCVCSQKIWTLEQRWGAHKTLEPKRCIVAKNWQEFEDLVPQTLLSIFGHTTTPLLLLLVWIGI